VGFIQHKPLPMSTADSTVTNCTYVVYRFRHLNLDSMQLKYNQILYKNSEEGKIGEIALFLLIWRIHE